MAEQKIKLCPYLPVTEERKAICIGQGDVTVTYFNRCLEEKCMAYINGKCAKTSLNNSENSRITERQA